MTPDHIKKGKRGGVKLSGFLAEWFRPVDDRLNLWKRFFCLLWHQEVRRELDCGCTYRWGFCRQADAFPRPFRSKLQCKRALSQKSGRGQNCQGCREDEEGEGLQMSFGMNNFIFVEEEIQPMAGEWKGDDARVWKQKWAGPRAGRGNSQENSAGKAGVTEPPRSGRHVGLRQREEVTITRWAGWRLKIQERLVKGQDSKQHE